MLNKLRFTAAARQVLAVSAVAFSAGASALPYTIGDVFASIGNGQVEVHSQTGVLKQTLNTGLGGYTTGGAFDSAGNFYVTSFSSNVVSKFDNNGNLVNASWSTGLGGFSGANESIVFDASGNAYIGNAGDLSIQKVNSSGAQIATYATLQNTDWIDLAADQVTVLYSNEGSTIRELNTTTLVDTVFTTGAYGALYAKRYLVDGSVLAASSDGVLYRWDSNGVLIDTIATGLGSVFALNLDPDGTSVWTGATGGQAIKKLDIATGNTLQSWNTSVQGQGLFGLTVYGEITTGNPPTDTPEPSIYLLFGAGLFALALSRRRQRNAAS